MLEDSIIVSNRAAVERLLATLRRVGGPLGLSRKELDALPSAEALHIYPQFATTVLAVGVSLLFEVLEAGVSAAAKAQAGNNKVVVKGEAKALAQATVALPGPDEQPAPEDGAEATL